MRMTDLKPLVEQALAKARERKQISDGVDHPQVREQGLKTTGEIDALENVLEAINGNPVFLKIMARD